MEQPPVIFHEPPDFTESGSGDQLGKLYAALAAAQAEFTEVTRSKTVTVPTLKGGTYSFAYAPMETLVHATRPALSKHGLAVLTPIVGVDARHAKVLVLITHADGGRLMFSFPFEPRPEIKDMGGQLTYLRRYCYAAALNLSADDDEDERTDNVPATRQPRQQAAAAPPRPTTGDDSATKAAAQQAQQRLAPAPAKDASEKPTQEEVDRYLARLEDARKLELNLEGFGFSEKWTRGELYERGAELRHRCEAEAARRVEAAKQPA